MRAHQNSQPGVPSMACFSVNNTYEDAPQLAPATTTIWGSPKVAMYQLVMLRLHAAPSLLQSQCCLLRGQAP